ncbi:MAG: choice-of-anchor D domain-containing protein, partial [Deltaproteobacteria bacterium]|nr:choice-of-anchor D domain-containing protein [Deltaproteobacteria bacterium]
IGLSQVLTLVVRNDGITNPMTITSAAATIPEYTVVPATAVIAPGANQVFDVTFTPYSAGTFAGNVTFVHDGTTSPDLVPVTGDGFIPSLVVDLDNPMFGTDGTTTTELAVGLDATATNGIDPALGESNLPPFPPAGIFHIRFDLQPYTGSTLSSWKDYLFAADPLTFVGQVEHTLWWQTSSPGLDVELQYNLHPNATMTITDQIGGSLLNIGPFNGSGTAVIPGSYTSVFAKAFVIMDYAAGPVPEFDVTPAFLDFGTVYLGSSKPLTVTVSNTGGADLVISSAAIAQTEFSVAPASATVPPAGNQVFTITFTPPAFGTFPGTLVFTHNAAGSPDNVPLTGDGYYPILVTSPNGGETWQQEGTYEITWTDNITEDVSIELYSAGSYDTTIISSTPSNGAYYWTIPASIPNGFEFKVRIVSTIDPLIVDFSDNNFIIASYNITITSPNGGESWQQGNSYEITYTDNIIQDIAIDLYKGGSFYDYISSSTPSIGSYNWIIPTNIPNGSDYKVRIFYADEPTIQDYSDDDFTIAEYLPVISISPPSLSFGDRPINSETGKYLTISNEGYATLEIYNIYSSDQAFYPDFSSQEYIQPGDSLELYVHFTPDQLGNYNGILTIDNNGQPGTNEVNLYGTGTVGDINYPSTIYIGTGYYFEDITQTNNYQIIGLPGDINWSLSSLIQGNYGEDWRAFWDEGSEAYLEYNQDQSKFYLKPGIGFWVISRHTINIDQAVNSVPLSTDKTFSIPLHPEWNLISNPFNIYVPWLAVQHLNSISEDIYYYHDGYSTYTDLYPNQGCYFMNATGLDSLKIPYIEYYD